MERKEFLDWLFNRAGSSDELIIVSENKVIYGWKEGVLGGINYKQKECTFEKFIELHNSGELKD